MNRLLQLARGFNKALKTAPLVLSLAIASQAFGGGGSDAGNGGGLAEKNITFAYLNLDRLISLCLSTSYCRATPAERELLAAIRAHLPKERSNPKQLILKSGKTDLEFFKIDGLVRLAKTGDHVSDPIYVNTDLLYSQNQGGVPRAMDIPLAASTLIHELGHHQGIKDHMALDLLGSKVQAMLLTDSQRAEFWNGNAAVITLQFNQVHSDAQKNQLHAIDALILENRTELYSLTDQVQQAVRCPRSLPNSQLIGLRIYNFHAERETTYDAKTRLLTKPFRAWYIESCDGGKESDHGDLKVTLVFKKTGEESFELLPDRTVIQQISCREDTKVCK